MKILKTLLILSVLLLISCSSDNGDDEKDSNRFPFKAKIEYRVSSSDNNALAQIYFVDQDKKNKDLTDVVLPYNKSFDVEVDFGDTFFINAVSSFNNLKVALYIDGKLIKEVQSDDPANNALSIVHQFGLVDVTSKAM